MKSLAQLVRSQSYVIRSVSFGVGAFLNLSCIWRQPLSFDFSHFLAIVTGINIFLQFWPHFLYSACTQIQNSGRHVVRNFISEDTLEEKSINCSLNIPLQLVIERVANPVVIFQCLVQDCNINNSIIVKKVTKNIIQILVFHNFFSLSIKNWIKCGNMSTGSVSMFVFYGLNFLKMTSVWQWAAENWLLLPPYLHMPASKSQYCQDLPFLNADIQYINTLTSTNARCNILPRKPFWRTA